MNADCVFCNRDKIKNINPVAYGVFSFEPLNPVVPGHRLFVPEEHVADYGVDPSITADVMRAASDYAAELPAANIITSKGEAATQSVFHLHIHVVPRTEDDGLKLPWTDQVTEVSK